MDFFEKTGPMAIGSRLRMLTDTLTRNASSIYSMYGLDFKPKWFPVFYMLADERPKSVTTIAREIGQSHPSVSTIVKELVAKGLVRELEDKDDRRRSVLTLSDEGRSVADQLIVILRDVDRAVARIANESRHDLWAAVAEWERLLAQEPMLDRVAAIKAERERQEVEIVDFKPEYREAFFELNRQWIERYWTLEPHDLEMIGDPEKNILAAGGHILVALYQGRVAGVCALCKMDEASGYDYELAKLAVDPAIQRKGIGLRLCRAAIDRAKHLGATTLFLENNTRLKPAIALYRKLGFRELEAYHPAYARGDIQMDLKL